MDTREIDEPLTRVTERGPRTLSIALASLAVATVLLGVREAGAVTKVWVCASGAWEAASCWDPASEPTRSDDLYINNGGEAQITSSGEWARTVTLGGSNGTAGSVRMTSGSLWTAGHEDVGYDGTGTFTQAAGEHQIRFALMLGRSSTGSGSYALGGGTLTTSSEYVGYSGSGAFAQAGGSNTLTGDGLWLGYQSGGAGTYDLSGGTLSVDSGEYVGYTGTGAFDQTGGSNTATVIFLGSDPAASGTYSLGDGTLSASIEHVGYSGSGGFTQAGGSNTVGTLFLGNNRTGSGTYTLGDGALSASFEYVGYSGAGTFTQSGGSNTVSSSLILGRNTFRGGGSTGTYELSGGSLAAANEYIGFQGDGTFIQTGGTNTVASTLTLAAEPTSTGTYDLQGGALHAGTVQVNAAGAFTQTGGAGGSIYVEEDFINQSAQSALWDTSSAYLGFVTGADGLHDLYLPGIDLGQSLDGYVDNFAWATMELAAGNTLALLDGNSTPGAGLYVGEILGLDVSGGNTIANVFGSSGLNVYYDETLLANRYLGGLAYDLTGGGRLMPLHGPSAPVPEPATFLLLGSALAGLGFMRRRSRFAHR